ncbi:MAG: GNAT family N-acetyltransferase [Bacillota bacterium]
MLIRWATEEDRPSWIALAEEVALLFGSKDMPRDPEFTRYMNSKISKHEALIAVRRMTRECMGIISFSRAHNRISWFAVSEAHRGKGVGTKLLRCAMNQLDPRKEITAVTFLEGDPDGGPARGIYHKFGFADVERVTDPLGNPRSKMATKASDTRRGGSFHYRYPDYARWAKPENCPVCRAEESDDPPIEIKEMEHSWLECSKEAQGCLFGKCEVLSKVHSEHFYDMPSDAMAAFMGDVQRAAQALHKVTGAVKINYEIHGNSMPHLHVHLFPRYLDDDFPSGPIDYRKTEPSPYESDEEFWWFVKQMRLALDEPT